MMHSPNSSCNNNLEPIPNYTTLFPENDTTSFFPNSPHIHLEYEDAYLQFLHLFYQHQSISNTPDHHNGQTQLADVSKPDHPNQPIIITATSMSKKDRHSKIHTARGPRDRRMRLSLDIARRFFHLQDLLGYDKASRTIEWLLHNAGPAITELAIGRGFSVPTSESSTCEQAHDAHQLTVSSKESKIRRSKKVKRATVERESRRKARERARERTSQKRRLITTVQSTSQDLPLGLISSHSSLKGSMDLSSHYQQQLCTTALPWNPSTLFNFQDEQIAEFEFSGKPWEDFHSFNSFNLSG